MICCSNKTVSHGIQLEEQFRYDEHLAHIKYDRIGSVAHRVLKSGYSLDKSSLKLFRHVTERRLLNAYKSPEIIDEDNLMNNDVGPIPYNY